MRKWIKKHSVIIVFVFIALFLIGVPFCINEAYKVGKGYETVWSGQDVLVYFGSAVSAFGTIALGFVAWKHNDRLLKLEKDSFLATNAVSAFLTEVTFTGINQKAVNLNEHDEQILSMDLDEKTYAEKGASITFICKLKPIGNTAHIAMVHVDKIEISCAEGDSKNIDARFSANNINEENVYSQVAISEDFDQFKTTVLFSAANKAELIDILKVPNSKINIDIALSLLSDKYVATALKCRAVLTKSNYDEKEGIYSHFKTGKENAPMSFWNGASFLDKQNITVRSQSKK